MTHELQQIFNVNFNGEILDFDFISDENFLLLVALTNKGNIITLHRSNNQHKCGLVPLFDVYSEYCEPILITLLPDASAVVLVMSNDSFLLIPIRCLMNAKWGDQSELTKPLQFKIKINVDDCLRLPTSCVSFKSVHSGRTYIAFSNKAGFINIVDLQLQRLIISVSTNETIHRLELYRSTVPAKSKFGFGLETLDLPLRENLAHTIVSEQIVQIEDQITTVNLDNFLTLFSIEKGALNLVDNIDKRNKLEAFTIPAGTWLTFYAPRLLLCVVAESDIYSSFPFLKNCEFKQVVYKDNEHEPGSRILGFVPISRTSIEELDRCLVVSNFGIFLLVPKLQIISLTLDQLIQSDFSKIPFLQICELIKKEPWALYETILRQVIEQRPLSSNHIDGLMLLAIEMAFDLKKLTALVNELGEYDALIPYLSICCDKDKVDQATRQLLFETYIYKLWKMDPNSKEKPKLEQDIRQFLIKFESSSKVIGVLLKHNLLSCATVVLQLYRTAVTPKIASHFIEASKWNSFDSLNLVRIICGLHWTILEPPIKNVLFKKLLVYLGHLHHLYEVAMISNFASKQLNHDSTLTTSLYLYSICVAKSLMQDVKCQPLKWEPVGLGSNFTVMIGDDRSVWTWGEFKAGSFRARNLKDDAGKTLERTTNDTLRSILIANGQENTPLFYLTKFPKELNVLNEIKEDVFGFCQVVCGTEHVLLLTSMGHVYTFGLNRFGQCGVGHKDPVMHVKKLEGDFGPIVSVHAGHYSSALIDQQGKVWTFGWSVHGQLAHQTISSLTKPTRVDQLRSFTVKDVALGYSHSLFLTSTGDVYGCGYMNNGELVADPLQLPGISRAKTWRLLKLKLPEPVEMIASGYFKGLAVSQTTVYQWGECPQTLKMNAFWQRRKNTKNRNERKSDISEVEVDSSEVVTDKNPSNKSDPTSILSGWQEDIQTSREHFKIRRVCDWNLSERPIRMISSGYNHSAILTLDGEILIWGQPLDCQLGYGTTADKLRPTQLVSPVGVFWSNVKCGRNTTVAVSDKGEVFTWGRNDRAQLGVSLKNASSGNGTLNSPAHSVSKRYFFKSTTNQKKRPVEVPMGQCIENPTLISGLACGVQYDAIQKPDLDSFLLSLINSCDQQVFNSTAQQLRIVPVHSLLALNIQLMAGDLVHAAENLSIMFVENRQRIQKEISRLRASTAAQRVNTTNTEPNHNKILNTLQQNDDPLNGNSFSSSTSPNSKELTSNFLNKLSTQASSAKVEQLNLDEFEKMIDQIWSLIGAHPAEDVKTLTVLVMLCKHLPIYGRVSMDSRLCRLIAGYVELPQKNALSTSSTSTTRKSNSSCNSLNVDSSSLSHSDYCTSSTLNRQRMNELRTPKERAAALRRARCPGLSKMQALKERVQPMIERFDFYASCGHFERRQQEMSSRVTKAIKHKLACRKCAQCVPKTS